MRPSASRPRGRFRVRLGAGVAAAVWSIPAPALAHSGPCSKADSLTTVGIGAFLGVLLFRPWRKSAMSITTKLSRWAFPVLALGPACGIAAIRRSRTAAGCRTPRTRGSTR